jgi:glycogen phosphorylase
MRALRSFTVRARLPEPIAPLAELAGNLRWSWDDRTRDLFRWVDPETWERSFHDPVHLLGQVGRERLDALAADPAFCGFVAEIHDDLNRYLTGPRWFQQRGEPSPLRAVAYFSPEFGIAEAVPQYSGGLGVLAGDHLKAASGLGLPFVAVGLLYRQGYFRQTLNAEGWQEERYPSLDPHRMALSPVDGGRVSLELAGKPLAARVWLAQVGRVRLYLLDADVSDNPADLRAVTDRLYGGGTEHRLRQEILLGIGGVRALHSMGAETQVFHTNEGHAGFLGLERIRRLITDQGLSLAEAVEAVRAGTVFTTHTPVPAGIDRFSRSLMETYFAGWADECNVSMNELMALGHLPDEAPDAPFNMAVMGLRLSGMANGVARLHGGTSRAMFQALWPSVRTEDVPIGSVTNGVHGRTWVSTEMSDLLSKYVSPAWDEAQTPEWARITEARDDEIWRVREQGRAALVDVVRDRLRRSLAAATPHPATSDLEWVNEVLDPRYLVVGFARRFATYKRATLLLSQPDRLRALLLDERRPLQLVFSGKAHPADEQGKAMIAQIVRFSRDPAVRHRIVFVEDYDIAVARMLIQGSDVWLNNPRRPMEASGTSGQKAALNGALNCSILDGWWDECFDGTNGWAIPSAEGYEDLDQRDRIEADALFEVLERQVIPLFYDRSGGRFSRAWVRRIKSSLQTLGPYVQASRMVTDYVEGYYEPLAERADRMSAEGARRARDLAAWKQRVVRGWPGVRVLSVDTDHRDPVVDLGGVHQVTVEVDLGELSVDDVSVEVLHGPVTANDDIAQSQVTSLTPAAAGSSEEGAGGVRGGPQGSRSAAGTSGAGGHCRVRYQGSFPCDQPGRYGFTVRLVPAHPDQAVAAETGCMAWA